MKSMLPFIVAGLAAAAPLSAQQSADELFGQAVTHLQNQEFSKARAVLDQMISNHGEGAMKWFGPRFGAVYYHRGLALLGEKKFNEAAEDFLTSARQFANKEGEARVNPYRTISLLQAGSATMQSDGSPEEALKLFREFEREMMGNPVDKENVSYNRAALWANTAICEARTGKPDAAGVSFAKIVDDPGGFDRKTRSTFDKTTQLTHSAAIEIVEGFIEAQQAGSGVAFIEKYRPVLTEDRGIGYFYVPRYLQAAESATAGGHYPLAMAIYSIIPTTNEVREGLERNKRDLEALPPAPGKTSAYMDLVTRIEKTLDENVSSGTPVEVYALNGTAKIFQEGKNFQAAYGIYRTLAAQYPKSKLRPQILYAAAAAASITQRLGETQRLGGLFIEEFPNHELRPAVDELLLEGLFWNQQYEDALRVGRRVRESAEPGSVQRDLADFVVGGSLYFLARYAEAEPILKEHVETYAESENREMVRFYYADNLARLNKYTEAGRLLDEFLRDYPETRVLDLALYSRADCHYNLDQTDSALSRLNEFFSKRPYSMMRDQAYNLLGNVNESAEKLEAAEEAYRKAKSIAQEFRNDEVAAQSLVFIMGMLAETAGREDDVVAAYHEFFEKYPQDGNRAKAAILALPALEKKNMLDEALDRLEVIIAEFGRQQDAFGLEDAIVSYAKYALKGGLTLDQLRKKLYNFPGVAPDALEVKVRLRMALIDVYESEMKKMDEGAAQQRLAGEINGLFNQLVRDFEPEKLSNYVLVRVGDYLTNLGRMDQAKPYFQQVLDSNNPEFKDKAQFNLAVILGQSEQASERAQAIGLLQGVLRDFKGDRRLTERATRMMAVVHEFSGEWEKVGEVWRAYLKEKSWVRYQTEAYYKIAYSQERRQLWADACVNYMQVVVLDPGNLLYSSPSWFRHCDLHFTKLGNKQEGYNQLFQMVDKIGHLEGDEEELIVSEAKDKLDPITLRLLDDRLQTNYIREAKTTLPVWEGDPGVVPIVPQANN